MLGTLEGLGFQVADARVQAGLVTGMVSFAGVVLTGGIGIWTWRANASKERKERDDLRSEATRDLRRALWSDILPIWLGLFMLGSSESKFDKVRNAFSFAKRRKDTGYTPYVMSAAEPLFDERLVRDVALLKTDEIEAVVRFFHQLKRHNDMAVSLRTPEFALLELNRKRAALMRLTQLEIQAEREAFNALVALEKRMGLPDEKTMQHQLIRAENARNGDQKKRSGS